MDDTNIQTDFDRIVALSREVDDLVETEKAATGRIRQLVEQMNATITRAGLKKMPPQEGPATPAG